MEELKIVYKYLKDLKPYENNPRNNDDAVDKVAESIKQFGFKVPLVVDKNNVIVAGDFVNDIVFQKMKTKHQDLKGFKARAILSSLVGEMCDSCIFLPIAFIGLMPAKALVTMGFWQVIIKVSYEIVILPVTAFVARKVSKYEVDNNG